MMKIAFVLLGLVSLVFSHSWMQEPLGGYIVAGVPSANQTAPCGFDGNYPAPVVFNAGEFVRVSWPLNGHNNDNVNIALLNTGKVKTADLLTVAYNNNTAGATSKAVNVRIPFDTPSGNVFLQWAWTGPFFTCASLTINAAAFQVTTITGTAGSASGTAAAGKVDYFDITPGTTQGNTPQNFLVSVTGPTGAKFVSVYLGSSSIAIPTAGSNAGTFSTATAQTASFGLCNDGTLSDLIIGVEGSAATAGDAYTVNSDVYTSLINVGTAVSSKAHSGSKFYTTQAFETFGNPRRIVVRSTSIPADFGMRLGNDCSFTTGLVKAVNTPTSSCIQLPVAKKATTRFIEVPAIANDYSIVGEDGSCSELNSSAFVTFSMVLLFVALFFLML